jgi:uncharacterized membrane protein YgdD (TMEM256/DUF423 family)
MDRTWLAIGSISMFVAVAAGAFGAHALRDRLPPDLLSAYEVAVRYQAYHALALIAVAILAERQSSPVIQAAGLAFALGTVFFSGSLYVLAITGARWLGAVTPIGGVLFLLGWLTLFWYAVTSMGPRASS